jgi:hypothetical protein
MRRCEPQTAVPTRSRTDPKVPKIHRYQVTAQCRLAITAILTMDRTSIALLNKAAA